MLTNAKRIANYKKQNGSDKLTPRQRRRVKAKAHRERDVLGEQIVQHTEETKKAAETVAENNPGGYPRQALP